MMTMMVMVMVFPAGYVENPPLARYMAAISATSICTDHVLSFSCQQHSSTFITLVFLLWASIRKSLTVQRLWQFLWFLLLPPWALQFQDRDQLCTVSSLHGIPRSATVSPFQPWASLEAYGDKAWWWNSLLCLPEALLRSDIRLLQQQMQVFPP